MREAEKIVMAAQACNYGAIERSMLIREIQGISAASTNPVALAKVIIGDAD
jgi:hypothetical protein